MDRDHSRSPRIAGAQGGLDTALPSFENWVPPVFPGVPQQVPPAFPGVPQQVPPAFPGVPQQDSWLQDYGQTATQFGVAAQLPGGTGLESSSAIMQIPSNRLGHILGFKGKTINKVKDVSGVSKLQIRDVQTAKMVPFLSIDIFGTAEQVEACKRLIEAVCNEDQSGIGHVTTYVKIEPTVVGKVMGHKGQTIQQLTEVTGCYIEIQQNRDLGAADQPQLFVAGTPDDLDKAVNLIYRFVAAPGSKLDAVLANPGPDLGQSIGIEADGPKEERLIYVPAEKKGHLLGLKGRTIDLIRKTSGVIKCSINADRTTNEKAGTVPVQIFGTAETVDFCQQLVERVIAGDHSGIGHHTDMLPIPANKVERIRGDRWYVINTVKDVSGAYLDLMQGPQHGVAPGETQLFIAGPPESVEQARAIVQALLNVMDMMPANGEISAEVLDSALGSMGLKNSDMPSHAPSQMLSMPRVDTPAAFAHRNMGNIRTTPKAAFPRRGNPDRINQLLNQLAQTAQELVEEVDDPAVLPSLLQNITSIMNAGPSQTQAAPPFMRPHMAPPQMAPPQMAPPQMMSPMSPRMAPMSPNLLWQLPQQSRQPTLHHRPSFWS